MFDRRKAELLGYVAAAVVIVLVAVRLLDSGGQAERTTVAVSGAAPVSRSAPPAAAAGRMLVVDVAGEVRRPGVYRVPAGSRVDAAVQQAGGVTRRGESAAVNLAMPLRDGQQIVVPRRGAAAPVPGAAAGAATPPAAAGGGTAAPAQPISLSTATVEQLDTLDGIGPTLATRIVQYRDSHGGFRSIEELRQVDGIGDKRFESVRQAVQP